MESNPYRPPESDVAPQGQLTRSIWWKIYFFGYLPILALSMMGMLQSEGAGIWEGAYLIVLVFTTVGLFGFTFLKRIFRPRIWLAALVLVLLTDAAYPFLTEVDLTFGLDRTTYLVSMAIGWVLAIPGYVALYLYSKSSNPIWNR